VALGEAIKATGNIRRDGMYMCDHYNTMRLDLDFSEFTLVTSQDTLADALCNAIGKAIVDTSKELERLGYDFIADATSDDAARAMIVAGEWEFDLQGNMV
jgi:hypothetical protein